MDAGKLNKLVTFLAPSDSQDGAGEVTPAWTTVICTVWASIRPLTGRQLALAQANTITSTATHEMQIRYRPEIRGQINYRVRYGDPVNGPTPNRFYRVNSILDTDEKHEELRLTVTEVVA